MRDSGYSSSLESLDSGLNAGFSVRAVAQLGLHIVLFAATLLSTTVFGFALARGFLARQGLNPEQMFDGYTLLARWDSHLWLGFSFSLPLMAILLAHEMGHYIECRRRRLDASLPYFLPSPTLLGTLGAFIRIRSPFYTREGLFDVGISGPIAGFVMLIPFLFAGVSMSYVSPAPLHSTVTFGTPLLMRAVEALIFPGVASSRILLHPMAIAALGGMLVTGINLLPVGQLDGGHIVYAILGERWHREVSNGVIAAMAVVGIGMMLILGRYYFGWLLWAVLLFVFVRRHPLTYDHTPISRGRLALSGAALVMFLSCICLVPVSIA